jgi:hypothetical protein
MIEVADNAKHPGPGRGQSEVAPSSGAQRAFAGKRIVLGIGLLLLAVVLWSLRDTVPSWLASRMAATVELATTNERDDARVTRAFDAAMRSQSAEATLESLPNQTKVRHSRLTVRAPSSNEAIEQASRLAVVMAATFKNEGEGTLSVDIRRRTTPVGDRTTAIAGTAMTAVAAVAGLLGVLLLAAAWLRLQSGPDRLPQPFWWLAVGGLALALAPMFLPGDIIMALFFMAIPVLIAGIIVWKALQLRQAASWPSTRARIIKSKIRAQHHRHAVDVTKVANVADIEYEFRLGDRVFRGTRVGLGEIAAAGLEATLNHYHVGASVPVYYDPKNPGNALLEREPPLPLVWLYAIAAAVLIAGLAIVAVFWNVSAILEGVEGYFPEKAFLPGLAFFTLGGLMVLAMLWASRRQVAEASGWPQTSGRIVTSTVEHYRQRVGGARTGTLVTFYEPVIEYSYRVDDREYHSTQLSFGGKAAGSQEIAEARAARYPLGSEVTVHYDPKNPSNAVLDLKVAYGVPLLAVAVVFLGLAFFFSGAFR